MGCDVMGDVFQETDTKRLSLCLGFNSVRPKPKGTHTQEEVVKLAHL